MSRLLPRLVPHWPCPMPRMMPMPCPCCRLPLLAAHCAVWPHTIVAAVYAPVSAASRLVCLSEAEGLGQLQLSSSASLRSRLGLGGGEGGCQYAGWSVEALKRRVRQVQKRAQKTGEPRCMGHGGPAHPLGRSLGCWAGVTFLCCPPRPASPPASLACHTSLWPPSRCLPKGWHQTRCRHGPSCHPCPACRPCLPISRSRPLPCCTTSACAGQCNLRVELWTELVSEELGPAVGLLPQAALQNRALQSMRPEVNCLLATLSVCPSGCLSVCLSVCPAVQCSLLLFARMLRQKVPSTLDVHLPLHEARRQWTGLSTPPQLHSQPP